MGRWIALVLLGLSLVLPAGGARAQQPAERETNVLIHLNRPVRVDPEDRATTVVVVGDDAVIAGTVEQNVVVLGGRAEISGVVQGNVVVVDGTLDLGPGARIGRDVTLVRSEIVQAPDATVGGVVNHRTGLGWAWGAAWLFWVSTTVFVIASGLIFAAVGGRQLAGAAGVLTSKAGGSLLTALLLWIVLPRLAVLAMITVIGIPLGLGVLIFVLPALWFLGYLVAGAGLGGLLVRGRRALAHVEHPYAAAALGLLLLQLLGFVPWIGAFLVVFAGFLGAGALALRSWRLARGAGTGGAPLISTR